VSSLLQPLHLLQMMFAGWVNVTELCERTIQQWERLFESIAQIGSPIEMNDHEIGM
jgi:hypothetical protein